MKLGPFLPIVAVFGLLLGCGSKDSVNAPQSTISPPGDPAVMWIARLKDRASERTYMRIDAPGTVNNLDSTITDPVFRTSGASINYQISGCDTSGLVVGFTYIAPSYYGDRFVLQCGKHQLSGVLACADLSVSYDCKDVVEFHFKDLTWDGVGLPVTDDSRNLSMRFSGGWRATFGEVIGSGVQTTINAIHVTGPKFEATLSHIERY